MPNQISRRNFLGLVAVPTTLCLVGWKGFPKQPIALNKAPYIKSSGELEFALFCNGTEVLEFDGGGKQGFRVGGYERIHVSPDDFEIRKFGEAGLYICNKCNITFPMAIQDWGTITHLKIFYKGNTMAYQELSRACRVDRNTIIRFLPWDITIGEFHRLYDLLTSKFKLAQVIDI